MYQIIADNLLIYDGGIPELALSSAKLKLEVNTSGSLSFTLPKSHKYYGQIDLMKSRIKVYDANRLVFDGRAYSPTVDLYQNDTIECEGILAFLNDTYQEPFEYFGDVLTLFSNVIDFHNSQVPEDKQFKIGEVSVTNKTEEGNITRSSDAYISTMELMKTRFFGSELGGYLVARTEADGNYIDYVEDFDYLGGQEVTQSINLIDAEKTITSDELATIIVPLGARAEAESGDRGDFLTIASVNDGKIEVESEEGISLYGRITKIVQHDDITDASNLKRAGEKDLAAALGVTTSVKLHAADLAKANFAVSPFILGTYVDTKIKNLDIDEKMLITKLSIDLLNPSSNDLTLGSTKRSLTGMSLKTAQTISTIRNDLVQNIKDSRQAILVDLRRETEVILENNSEQILTTVAENYYNQAQMDELYSSLSTQIEQTAEAITFTFNEFKTDQTIVNGENQDIFEEWRKYIRFVDGNIVIGIEDNPLILQLQNDRINFLEDGNVIAYWMNKKFYAVDGEFLNSLKLGKFAFFPRTSGNLSFFKVES